ncbi:HIT-TYPE ZINC FINGER FAMILY PROTEIN-RELATED [Salix purpurea]|uniref:Protein TIC 20 n=1 Tax=Salix purpurea TaxID=77065 RepID=A0A9Q0WU85_SALPP|nr:HIT-TYPE ZINC FINGER FAMILY PROTEIN-RELATED [Salix purpurea]
MLLSGRTMPSGSGFTNTRACTPMPGIVVSARVPRAPSRAALLNSRASLGRQLDSKPWSSRGLPSLLLSAASTHLLSGDYGRFSHNIPTYPRQRRSYSCPRASKDVPYSYRFPPMTKKPRWWWRTFSMPALFDASS